MTGGRKRGRQGRRSNGRAPGGISAGVAQGGAPTRLVEHRRRFRLGDLAEALHHELPAVADLADRLAIDLEVDRDTITQAWFVASAFPPATRRPSLPWATYYGGGQGV